jgi:hypothetical protein
VQTNYFLPLKSYWRANGTFSLICEAVKLGNIEKERTPGTVVFAENA